MSAAKQTNTSWTANTVSRKGNRTTLQRHTPLHSTRQTHATIVQIDAENIYSTRIKIITLLLHKYNQLQHMQSTIQTEVGFKITAGTTLCYERQHWLVKFDTL